MAKYDIYIGTEIEEATAHGAEYVYDGMDPAHALCMLVNDKKIMNEIVKEHPDITELAAFDDDLCASIFMRDYGFYELHVYVGQTDTLLTYEMVVMGAYERVGR